MSDSLRPHESQHIPGLPVHHQLLESTQTHVHRVSDAIQPSHLILLLPQSLPASGSFPMSQLFTKVAKVLEFCCCCCCCCCFSLWWAECGVNPVCWWLGLYFCFVCCLDEASCTGCYWRVLLAFGWCQVLYTSGCICGRSHYWILRRVISLVV